MKIRTDFVTNSSSSSFCIFGIASTELYKILHNDENEDIYDALESRCTGKGLDYVLDGEGETVYVGACPEGMEGDKTINQIKEEIVKKLTEEFKDIDFSLSDVSWHSGEIPC